MADAKTVHRVRDGGAVHTLCGRPTQAMMSVSAGQYSVGPTVTLTPSLVTCASCSAADPRTIILPISP